MKKMHLFFNNSFTPPFPKNLSSICLGMGCFWGAEKVFWKTNGVYTTAVGYAGGDTVNPNYELVCTGTTNHAEVVLIVYDKKKVSLENLLNNFFISHDPTQKNRQGNDIGTQYRSIILVNDQNDLEQSKEIKKKNQFIFDKNQLGLICTEINILKKFYYAEDYHQQYLIKNPNGYCNLKKINITEY